MSQPENPHQASDAHKDITVETLRTPPLHIPPAPLSKRFFAGLIDSVIIALLWLLLAYLSGLAVRQRPSTDLGYMLVITFVYYFLQEWVLSFTLGKRLLGLRVVGGEGDPLSMSESLIRNLVRFVDWLPAFYILGGISVIFSKDKRRLGDMVGRTIVTRTPEKDINPPPVPFLFH